MGQKIRCNRACGAADLHWRIVNGKYKLFGSDHLLHICKDGLRASYDMKKKATAIILNELDLNNVEDIPLADDYTKIQKKPKSKPNLKDFTRDDNYGEYDPAKMFTITSTASGISITGDDKHNPIYVPKIAIPEMLKALVDFIC